MAYTPGTSWLYLITASCSIRRCLVMTLLKIIRMNSLGRTWNSAVVYFPFLRENNSRSFSHHRSLVSTRSETGRSIIIVFHALGGNGMIASPCDCNRLLRASFPYAMISYFFHLLPLSTFTLLMVGLSSSAEILFTHKNYNNSRLVHTFPQPHFKAVS